MKNQAKGIYMSYFFYWKSIHYLYLPDLIWTRFLIQLFGEFSAYFQPYVTPSSWSRTLFNEFPEYIFKLWNNLWFSMKIYRIDFVSSFIIECNLFCENGVMVKVVMLNHIINGQKLKWKIYKFSNYIIKKLVLMTCKYIFSQGKILW